MPTTTIVIGIRNAETTAPAMKGAHHKGSLDLAISITHSSFKSVRPEDYADEDQRRHDNPETVVGFRDERGTYSFFAPPDDHHPTHAVERCHAVKYHEGQHNQMQNKRKGTLENVAKKNAKGLAALVLASEQDHQK